VPRARPRASVAASEARSRRGAPARDDRRGAASLGRVGEHTRFPIARLRYTATTGLWSLYWRDRSLKFHVYEQLAENASNVDELLVHFGEEIDSARVALEDGLRGHDSFDAIAFLRFAVGPWGFSEVRESESQFENRQTAQDVRALTLLGMGLPRRQLTGENSGQPDLGKAMGLAAEIVRAANTRALVLGQRVRQPLGAWRANS
jgi:hypothetical protein